MDAGTDRELVLGCWPEAVVEVRTSVRKYGQPTYRVAFAPARGRRRDTPVGWCSSAAKAWRAACVRLGLRARKT